MMKELERRIEELRIQLNRMVEDIEHCNKEEILEVSRKLDKAIFEYMKFKENTYYSDY